MRFLSKSHIFLAAVILLPNFAWAAPPFVTDDPEPVEYKHWEVNYIVSGTWSKGDASAALPGIDINYGFLPDVQLHIQPTYSYEKQGDKRFGIDNTEIGVKYRFINIKDGDNEFIASFYPSIELPTGDTKLGPGRNQVQTFLPVWVQRNTEKWTIYGGAGYHIHEGIGSKNSWLVGAAALYQLTNSLEFGGEIFNETADEVGGKDSTGFNLGGIYNLSDDYHLLFSAGRGLSNVDSTNQFSGFLGLQVIY